MYASTRQQISSPPMLPWWVIFEHTPYSSSCGKHDVIRKTGNIYLTYCIVLRSGTSEPQAKCVEVWTRGFWDMFADRHTDRTRRHTQPHCNTVAGAKVWNSLCQKTLHRPCRCRCSRTGWRHTCSAAATKLFHFEWHSPFFPFPFSCTFPLTVVLAIVLTV